MSRVTLGVLVAFAAISVTSVPGYDAEPISLFVGQAYAGEQPCKGPVTDHLKRLKVDEKDVTKIGVLPVKTRKGKLLGYRAWVSLKSCRGSLVINTTTHCKVIDEYTRGTCKIDGLTP